MPRPYASNIKDMNIPEQLEMMGLKRKDNNVYNEICSLNRRILEQANQAITKIDQLTNITVSQSGIQNNLDRSRLDNGPQYHHEQQSCFGQSQMLFNQNDPNLNMTIEKSCNNQLDCTAFGGALNGTEFTPVGKYQMERRFTEVTDKRCDTVRTQHSHFTMNTNNQMVDHCMLKSSLNQIRQLIHEQEEKQRLLMMEFSAQKKIIMG